MLSDKPILKGPYAEGIDEEFLAKSYVWFQDESLRKSTLTPYVSHRIQIEWFKSLPSKSGYKIWGIKYNGEWIGAFGLKQIDISSGRAEYWGYIGDERMRGKGIGKWMINTATDLAIGFELGILFLKVWKGNKRAINLYKSFGFNKTDEQEDLFWMEKKII